MPVRRLEEVRWMSMACGIHPHSSGRFGSAPGLICFGKPMEGRPGILESFADPNGTFPAKTN
jgi:hypothetical protein